MRVMLSTLVHALRILEDMFSAVRYWEGSYVLCIVGTVQPQQTVPKAPDITVAVKLVSLAVRMMCIDYADDP
jgi:hypothetical protein